MTNFDASLPIMLLALTSGAGAGLVYFALLSSNLELYLDGAAVKGAALQASRFLLAAGVLFGAVQFGAMALIACAVGLLAGRYIVLRHKRKET